MINSEYLYELASTFKERNKAERFKALLGSLDRHADKGKFEFNYTETEETDRPSDQMNYNIDQLRALGISANLSTEKEYRVIEVENGDILDPPLKLEVFHNTLKIEWSKS